MINRLIEFSARNRFVVFLLVARRRRGGGVVDADVPLDAIPDLSDTQVIVYSRWDRSPDIVEDQVTYPIVTAMLGAPRVKAVRGFSDFGYLVRLHHFRGGHGHLLGAVADAGVPVGRAAATAAGREAPNSGRTRPASAGYSSTRWSTRRASTASRSCASYQDWYLRYHLKSVPGVAEVAPIGGFVRQYQVNVDPNRLRAYNIPIDKVVEAVRGGQQRRRRPPGRDRRRRVHGPRPRLRAIDARTSASIVLDAQRRRRARCACATSARSRSAPTSGAASPTWTAPATWSSGIVVMRQGENALDVIERVKAKLKEIEPGLPPGVKIVTAYDRSELILRSIDNLKHTLIEELVIVVARDPRVPLAHPERADSRSSRSRSRSSIAFIPMRLMGVTSNIMSLGGIAIAVGAMVDAAIVVVEQTHKKLEEWERDGTQGGLPPGRHRCGEGGRRPELLRLLVIAVSFLPVLTLEAQEGRLFKPLAYTKNFSMIVAAVLAITLDPAHAADVHAHAATSSSGRDGWRGSRTRCWSARSTPRRRIRSAAF